jgi:DNA-binding NtrC family response regulator
MSRKRILIVEDEPIVQVHLRKVLDEIGYDVVDAVTTADEALRAAETHELDAVLMDIRLAGDRDGIETASELRGRHDLAIVFLTAYADEKTVKRTEAVGAMGYLVKPFTTPQVRAALATAIAGHERLRTAHRSFQPAEGEAIVAMDESGIQAFQRLIDEKQGYYDLIGQSPVMLDVFTQIQELARVDWTVLIEGETGTGKELVARAIHAASSRNEQKFVAVNCAGLTDSLLGSQLFGHRKGAFTSAMSDQIGVFEAADRGTLFLDEIGDISEGLQKTLLRVLEDKQVTRLGESESRRVDVRLIAATQRDLRQRVLEEQFRADLLFRLRVARIKLPPLSERTGDVELLANSFLIRSVESTGKPVRGFSEEALQRLLTYDWPGNVRELKSTVESAVLACRGDRIELTHLPAEVREGIGGEITGATERERILMALDQTGGNRSEAARLLGVSRSTLYRRMAELEIP